VPPAFLDEQRSTGGRGVRVRRHFLKNTRKHLGENVLAVREGALRVRDGEGPWTPTETRKLSPQGSFPRLVFLNARDEGYEDLYLQPSPLDPGAFSQKGVRTGVYPTAGTAGRKWRSSVFLEVALRRSYPSELAADWRPNENNPRRLLRPFATGGPVDPLLLQKTMTPGFTPVARLANNGGRTRRF